MDSIDWSVSYGNRPIEPDLAIGELRSRGVRLQRGAQDPEYVGMRRRANCGRDRGWGVRADREREEPEGPEREEP